MDPAAPLQLAQRLATAGDIVLARVALDAHIAATPNDAAAAQLREIMGRSIAVAYPAPANAASAPSAEAAEAGIQQAIEASRAGNVAAATAAYQRLIDAGSTYARPFANLGLLKSRAGALDDALAIYRRGLAYAPDDPGLLFNLGTLLFRQRDLPLAILCFRRVAHALPDWADAHYNLGVALHEAEQYEAAADAFRRGAQVKPDDSRIWNNLGNSLFAIGTLDAAIGCYSRALALREAAVVDAATGARSVAAIRYNRGLARLSQGDYIGGFADTSTRYDDASIVVMGGFRAHASPRWRGEELAGKTLLIAGEQGMGDTVQFARYLPLLKMRGARILFHAHTALLPLLRDWGAIDGLLAVEGAETFDEKIDFHAPLLDLPHVFGTTVETIPSAIPYLHADAARIEAWRTDLPKEQFKVGIVWAGNPANPTDRRRSCALEDFAPLARVPGVELYSLQKGAAVAQLASATFPVVDLSDRLADFADTAAVLEALDLVISVDTAVVHVAGALGRPAWVLLHDVPDWRWLRSREDSIWYPTLRLFRQAERGSWRDVFERVVAALPAEIGR